MSLFLSKLIPLFVYPLGAALVLGSAALVLSFTRFRVWGSALLAAALIVLWVASTPVLARWLIAELEARHPPIHESEAPEADAIILLGGAVRQPLPPRVGPDLSAAADRLIAAMRLYRVGKAPVIVIAAGNISWEATKASEAELTAGLLVDLGVPRDALVLETGSRNTRENALNTAEIFEARGWRTGLLVTSASHMPRALATFRKVGLQVTPVATDIVVTYPLQGGFFRFLPRAGALAATTSAVKEWIGHAVYRYREWI